MLQLCSETILQEPTKKKSMAQEEMKIDHSTPSSICCGLLPAAGATDCGRPMQIFFRGQQQQPGNGILASILGCSEHSTGADGTTMEKNPYGGGGGVIKSVHNQVAPITIEPTQEHIRNYTEESKDLPRLDGWSEDEIMSWTPDNYEKELVKRTWSDDFDFLYDLGGAIYTYIFEHNPHTKELFPKIHQHGDDWKDSSDFRSQALKFVQTLSYATKNLYHMDECLQPRLFRIGEHHVKYAARGFKPDYWNIFLDAMECALIKHIHSIDTFNDQQKADATRVWRQLAHYIIAHMKCGYQAEEKKQQKRKHK